MTRMVLRLLSILALLAIAAGPASARALESARAQGLVGDQADGYLGIVSGGTGALQEEVARINAERAAEYARIAKEQATTPTAVGVIFGQQLYAQTPSGEYFRDASGTWVRKP